MTQTTVKVDLSVRERLRRKGYELALRDTIEPTANQTINRLIELDDERAASAAKQDAGAQRDMQPSGTAVNTVHDAA